MEKLVELKKEKLEKEIILLKHYTNSSLDTDDLYIRIEHVKNKTLIAEKEFSLSEITGEQKAEKRLALHQEEENYLNEVESKLWKNWNEFPLGEFIIQRIPNFMEALRPGIIKSAVEVLLPDELRNAENPTSKAFVRDGTKIFDAIWKWHDGQQIGYSKYSFDDFLLIGTVSKILCKLSLIFGLGSSVPLPIADLSRASNYICEVPSRLLTKIHRLHQDTFSKEEIAQQSLLDKINFAYKHFTSDIMLEAIYSSISKTITTDFLGSLYGKACMVDRETKVQTDKTSKIHLIDLSVNKLGIEEIQMLKPIDNIIPGFSILHFLNSFLQQLSKTGLDTYALTTPARIVEDLPGIYINSDISKTSYLSTKFLHFLESLKQKTEHISTKLEHLIYYVTQGHVDTKKNYGISEFLEKLFGWDHEEESTLEQDIANLSKEIEMIKGNLNPQADITEELAQDITQISGKLEAISHDEL